jgi:hypothetical protein
MPETSLTLKKDKLCKHSVRYRAILKNEGKEFEFTIYVPNELCSKPPKEAIEVTVNA